MSGLPFIAVLASWAGLWRNWKAEHDAYGKIISIAATTVAVLLRSVFLQVALRTNWQGNRPGFPGWS